MLEPEIREKNLQHWPYFYLKFWHFVHHGVFAQILNFKNTALECDFSELAPGTPKFCTLYLPHPSSSPGNLKTLFVQSFGVLPVVGVGAGIGLVKDEFSITRSEIHNTQRQ